MSLKSEFPAKENSPQPGAGEHCLPVPGTRDGHVTAPGSDLVSGTRPRPACELLAMGTDKIPAEDRTA